MHPGKVPHTPFSTEFHGGVGAARARFRNLLRPGRRAHLLTATAILLVALAGGLVTFQQAVTQAVGPSRPAQSFPADAAIPNQTLAGLLAAQFPEPATGDTWELIGSYPGDGCTLGALRYTAAAHAAGFGNLVLCVFDNATRQPLSKAEVVRADVADLEFLTKEDEGSLCLLYTAYTEYQGQQDCTAGMLDFDGRDLVPVTALPSVATEGRTGLPNGIATIFTPAVQDDFWADHKAVMAAGGLDLFVRGGQSRWDYQCYLPMSRYHPDIKVMEQMRGYFQALFRLDGQDASNYPLLSTAFVIDYQDPDWPQATVMSGALSSGSKFCERMFLFDQDGELFGVRSNLDFSLRFGGRRRHLGERDMGTHYKTSRIDASLTNGAYPYGSTVGQVVNFYDRLHRVYDPSRRAFVLSEPLLGAAGCSITVYFESTRPLTWDEALNMPITALELTAGAANLGGTL